MALPPPPAHLGAPPAPPVSVASRINRLSTPLPLRPSSFQAGLPSAGGSLSSPSLLSPASSPTLGRNLSSSASATTTPGTPPPPHSAALTSSSSSAAATSPLTSSVGYRRSVMGGSPLHSSGDTALLSGQAGRTARFSSSVSLLGSPSTPPPAGGTDDGQGNSGSGSGSASPASALSPTSSPRMSKRKSMFVNPFSRSSSSSPPPLSPKSSSDAHPVTAASAYSPLDSPKNRKTVVITPSSSSSSSSSPSSPSPSSFSYASSSSSSPYSSSSSINSYTPVASPSSSSGVTTLNPLTVNSSVSPRKNNVQLLNITGGGGGGVIKEMSASLLKTLLGGDNAKYPVILDFSKGYLLANDYFVASCPDIIKEINLSHNQITECNSLSHLSKLKHLFLDNNKVSDISFEGLVSLKILSLMGNELEYLTSMSDLDKLEHLNLSGNKLTAGFHELAKLKSLLSLNLSNNNFNFTLRKFYSFLLLPLKKHTKLQSLAIGRGNPGANNIPNFRLWVIHELPQLKILDERPVEKSEVEEAARLEATGQWADKDGDRLEKKGNWTAPAESTTRVVASHLNIGTAPAPEEPAAAQPRVVKRADHLNVGGGGDAVSAPGSPSMTSATPSSDTPKVVVRRPDLNVTIGGDSSEDEGSSHGSGRKKKEKEKKDKGKKEKKGSGIKTTTVLGKKSSGNGTVRSRAGSETDDRDKWPTDPSILAKIASSLPVPASAAAAAQARPPSTDGATAQRLSQQLTASQTQFVGGAQQQHQQPKQEEGSVETRIDYLRSFFLLDELSHTLCLFAQAAATPVWGATEFLHLNNQLKQLVVHTKVMYERVQQFLARYPFEEKRITDATVVVQNNIRGLVISVKQLNEAQARGGTVATAISAAKELALALFRMFNIVEEGAIPSTDETAADIQECARGVMKLIQIATGMSRELHIDQYSELLLQQSERLSHQLNIKIPTLQNPEVQRRAAASTGSINGSITKLIALSKQYQADPSPLLLQEIRHTAQTIATEFQSINSMVHTSRFASPLSPYDERVMYETSHQLLVEENNYVGIHEDAMLPNERQVLDHMKTMMQLAGEIKAVVSLKPVSTPHLMQLVLDMSSVGAATCHQLYVTAANYADRATREQLERYGRAIRYYSFLERIALCSLILNFAAPDVLHLSTSMKGQAFCTSNAIKMILLSALTQAPQLSGPKRHSGVNFDDLLSMLQ